MATLTGIVTAVQANYYWVHFSPPVDIATSTSLPPLLCTRRTRLKKMRQQVMVGDSVLVELPASWQNSTHPAKIAPPLVPVETDLGAITKVHPRKTEIQRPPVANAEQWVLVFSLADPPLEPWQLSRFLVQAEATGLMVLLCLNKQDLVSSETINEWQCRLQRWGYEPLIISVAKHTGITQLQQQLQSHMSLMAGPSGVGKSSLINDLVPQVDQRVAAVSGKLRKGRHTTRHVELFSLPNGGLLADTPGFNQPQLAIIPAQLIQYFPEVRESLHQHTCHYHNCLHRGEPGCIIPQGWERYEHYLAFLEETLKYEAEQKERTSEATVKQLIGEDGQQYVEPRLETRKYRRRSRRQQHQDLQDLCDSVDFDNLDDD